LKKRGAALAGQRVLRQAQDEGAEQPANVMAKMATPAGFEPRRMEHPAKKKQQVLI